jgi:predicted transcriptional regulator
MYEVRLSFSQVKGYLKYLQQVELLSYDEESRVFRTTRKGKNFLELYNGMAELISGRKREKYADTDNI